LDLVANKNRLNDCVGILAEVFELFCARTESAETWSLKGRAIQTVGLSPGAGIGCWSSAFEATKILMEVLIRCCGYFSREKITLNRSNYAEKYD